MYLFMKIIKQCCLVRLGAQGSNKVQVALTGRGDTTTTITVLFDQVELFQGLHGLAEDGARGVAVLGGTDTVVLATTVVDGQGTNTSTGTDVQVTSDGG